MPALMTTSSASSLRTEFDKATTTFDPTPTPPPESIKTRRFRRQGRATSGRDARRPAAPCRLPTPPHAAANHHDLHISPVFGFSGFFLTTRMYDEGEKMSS